MAMPLTVPRFTVDDLEQWPRDGNRYELLDGVLLVTPPPSFGHQGVIGQLALLLGSAVGLTGLARVVAPGAIYRGNTIYFEPDILVVPSSVPLTASWRDITEHWLVVEVLSRSTRIYDREFKRRAYLALGVREVWLVDRDARTIETARLAEGAPDVVIDVVTDIVRWRPPGLDRVVEVDLRELFRGLDAA